MRALSRLVGTIFLMLGIFSLPETALACATCYGAIDSPMARGMQMAIVSLLGVTYTLLGGIGAFFIYLVKRNAQGKQQDRSN